MPQLIMPIPPPQPGQAARQLNVDELSAPATQVVRDRDAYLGQNRDIGRRLTDDQVELFVTEEPAVALQREFERLEPPFIALHDVGTAASLRLLQTMASTTGKVMRLSIRRQGHGVALATVQFVEITGAEGSTLRVYSTDVDADTHARQLLARTLVAHARLAVLVFGDLPTHALGAGLQPLVDAVGHEKWPLRHMLMIPLGAPAPLNGFAGPFRGAGIQTQIAPRVARASDAWSFIGSTWNQIESIATGTAKPARPQPADDDSGTPTEKMGLVSDPPHMRAATNWFDYVQRCASVKGMISCCVFDLSNGQALAHAGGRPPAEVMQALGQRLISSASDIGAMMGTGPGVNEVTVSFPGHHLLLRALPGHRGVVLHALLDSATGNMALARAQLQRLDPV